MKRKVYQVGNETLVGNLFTLSDEDKAKVVFLHGGGNGSKDARYYMQEKLLERGISSFAFDFSGHGESSGEISSSSLEKRFVEAKESIEKFLSVDEGICICGSSMGGHIAIKLLELFSVNSLILIAPAIYSKQAFNIDFDKGFTEELRRNGSFRDNDTMELINKYDGNLLLILGEKDKVIPKEIVQLMSDNVRKLSKSEIITLENCPHKVHSWIESHPALSDGIADKIVKLC